MRGCGAVARGRGRGGRHGGSFNEKGALVLQLDIRGKFHEDGTFHATGFVNMIKSFNI